MNAWSKRLALALALSVGLNLFLASFLAARMFHHGSWRGHTEAAGPFFGPRGFMRGGHGPGAEAMRGVMLRQADALRAERARLRQAQDGVRTALSAEPFDAQALDRALAELRASTADSQKLMHAALLEVARSLPADQRRRLAHDVPAFGRGRPGGDGF